MKNKNNETDTMTISRNGVVKETHIYHKTKLEDAARIIQEHYTKLANRQEPGSQMSKDFNFVRLEMNNLRQVLND